jgi:hypothetical protein
MENKKKGICRLGIVPVRSNPNDQAEMVSQLLFGDHYSLNKISEDGKWVHVTIEFDQYQGWIDIKQHSEISEAYFNHLNNAEYKISTDITSTILFKQRLIQIVVGSMLPISSYELFEVNEQFAFNGASKNIGEKQGFDFMKHIMKNYMNAPYLWGGKSPFGIDCSGLTQQIFKLCGYKLKRDALEQYQQGSKVESLTDAQPGDLAFFRNDKNKISHVGIILDYQDIIHASAYVRKDKIDENGIFNEELSTYTHNLDGIKRILKT